MQAKQQQNEDINCNQRNKTALTKQAWLSFLQVTASVEIASVNTNLYTNKSAKHCWDFDNGELRRGNWYRAELQGDSNEKNIF